ncbi:hypothetical protein LOD99_15999 [Oopsacas minuta]|uniref:Cullin family profile domain-containing protein n=1 Tax=Oopsacas minuta TaxID=111878 RepID=A0AAV7K7R3_9METZ|nr:hypothetical protein LOD99_15999 [Oopsacas minuta]
MNDTTILIRQSFDQSQQFTSALDSACTRFINNNSITKLPSCSQVKSPELIAKYCDLLLRKSAKNPDDTETEELLSQIMIIFRYIEDKDVFQKFYSRMLAKRLVAGQSASDDAEASMITKLKQACGFEYTTKLQRMFQDVHLSRELNEKLKTHHRHNPTQKFEIDFSIQVLTSGSWPFQSGGDFCLPQALERPFTRFTQFYNTQYSGRVLTWLHHMSKGEIVTNCYKQKYTLQLSTYQMAFLLLFNELDQICLENIHTQLLIKEEVILQMSAVLLKTKLLECCDNENQLTMKSVLKFNTNFKSKKLRINLNVPLKLDQKIEQEATEKHVDDDRKIIIQAAIVRIMKMRKELGHQPLLSEVVGQISNIFKPKVHLIKKCIDILIEKDFLERVDGQKDIYIYLA